MKQVAQEIDRSFRVETQDSVAMVARAAPATATEAPVVGLVSAALRAVRKVEPVPMGIGGGTVAALFRKHGIAAVVWSTMDDLAHQPNEYCVIDNLVEDSKVFAHMYIAPK